MCQRQSERGKSTTNKPKPTFQEWLILPYFSVKQLASAHIIIFQIQMHESYRSDDISFLDDSGHNPLAPIKVETNFQRNPVFYNNKANPNKTSNRIINVLAPNKSTNRLEFNEEFQDYLALDQANSNLNIVTFIGPKQIGKSFLIDFLISKEEKSSSRLLTKNGKNFVNMPTYEIRGKNGEKIIFFDSNEDISNQAFLWTYFLSSIVVLNLQQGDKKGEEQFLSKLDSLRIGVDSSAEDLTLPQLIILRRDSSSKEFKDKDFLTKIESTGLFSTDVVTMNMAYPGNSSVTSKDIKDVAENLLSEAFINDALNLSWIIKSGKPKSIKGNILGSKIAGLTLDPLTKSINKLGKADTNKIWNDVIETLSVGYYNYYIKKYTEELQGEFSDQQPCDKYTLYKRLSKVKRNVDKKVEGFNSIAGDPTFEKYREKLQEKISNKEKIIKEINKQKSIKKNDELCKKLFSEMNDANCEALIQKYCESKLDDNKTEVLLDNFETVIKKRLSDLEKSKGSSNKPTTQIQQLQRELKELQQRIQTEKKANVEVVHYDFAKIQHSIEEKEKEVKELEKELARQKEISNQKKTNQNKDIIELQKKIEHLKSTTKEQEREIEKLKAQKQLQAKATIDTLNKKLQEEEQKYKNLRLEVEKAQEQARQLKKDTTKPAAKDSCCEIM